MSFQNIRFPELVSLHATGGPRFLVDRVAIDSGQEYHNAIWSEALWEYEVNHSTKLDAYFTTLRAFFLAVAHGGGNGFRFKDWTDYKVSSTEGKFTTITSTTFQAYKEYKFGSAVYKRTIRKLVNGTTTITGGSGGTFNLDTGVCTVSSGTPTSWVGEFDVPVWLQDDDLSAEIVSKTPSAGQFLWNWNSIRLREVRTPDA